MLQCQGPSEAKSSGNINTAKEEGKEVKKKKRRKKVFLKKLDSMHNHRGNICRQSQESTRTSRQTFTSPHDSGGAHAGGRLLVEREFVQGCRVQEGLGEKELLLKPQSLYKPLCRVMKRFLFALLSAFYAQAFISLALRFITALCSVLLLYIFYVFVSIKKSFLQSIITASYCSFTIRQRIPTSSSSDASHGVSSGGHVLAALKGPALSLGCILLWTWTRSSQGPF